ncbi:hypothetical protein J2R62_15040 [Plesiomonas shigelloides]|uniref:Uncharacterized protein n=1 Tax=Plesiomonas shigelloides TaxID=703 RepID=A0A8I1W904_PLESH|nr:hypothetical protein [Plesiomonas shigelloides]MBO1109501.1 hypothetical protein [Plesiomonas shigelloides]
MNEMNTQCSNEYIPHPNDPVSDEYMELKNEPVLYEWEIEVQQYQRWLVSVVIGGGFLLLWIWTSFKDGAWFISPSSAFLFLGVVSVFSGRYLALPNQLFYYSLTPKGVYYTKQDKLPDNFYLVINMLGWLLVLVSLVAVAVIGPFALVGAGSGAFMAMGMTKMRAKVSHLGAYFYEGPIEMRVYSKGYMFDTISEPFSIKYHLEIYCTPENYGKIISDIKSYLPNHTEVNLSSQRDFLK